MNLLKIIKIKGKLINISLSMFNHAGIVKHSIIIENKTANNFKYFISPHFETFINIIEIHRVLQEFNIYCK